MLAKVANMRLPHLVPAEDQALGTIGLEWSCQNLQCIRFKCNPNFLIKPATMYFTGTVECITHAGHCSVKYSSTEQSNLTS